MIIADTDVLIDFLRGKGVADEVEEQLNLGTLATTSITAFELWSGAQTAREQKAVSTLLEAVKILALDHEGAKRAAEVRRSLEQQAQPIGMADSLIAGICLIYRGILLGKKALHSQQQSKHRRKRFQPVNLGGPSKVDITCRKDWMDLLES